MTKPRPYGHYFILEKIAQGGMAEIFKGLTYDFSGLKKFIVIKRILPHIAVNKNFIKMLIDEAKIAVRLSHGNIAQTYDLGKVADDYFIVMEYVDGRTLSQIFKKSIELKKNIPIPMTAYIVGEICHGLNYMHRAKDELGRNLEIVHRDISPQNIIVTESGSVKIVDFGVAKAAFKLSEMERGILKGKFAYMSPEQTEGDMVDARSDIFSTGVVLWEMLTGRRLFKKKSNAETIDSVQNMTVYPPSAYRNEIPSDLDQIVMRALERDPNQRYATAADISLDLTKFLLKYYPEFKPNQNSEFLQEIFTDEDNTGDLYQEKTMHEELTIHEAPPRILDFEETKTPIEETMIVDPLELDFHSVFEEIDVDEPSDVTHAINLDEQGNIKEEGISVSVEELPEDEDTGDYIELQNISKAQISNSDQSKLNLKKDAIIGALILFGIILVYFCYKLFFSTVPATLRIVFDPPDGNAYLEGKALEGSSPILLNELQPHRRYQIKINRDGYESGEESIYLFSGINRTAEIHLKKKNAVGFQVTSSPSGAAIFIDGQLTGKVTPYFLEAKNLSFPLVIGLSKGGPPTWQKRFENASFKTEEVFGNLAQNYGNLNIESSPSGVAILINGANVGKTPLYAYPVVSEKKVKLTLKLDGFKTYDSEIQVSPGQKQSIYQALQKNPSR